MKSYEKYSLHEPGNVEQCMLFVKILIKKTRQMYENISYQYVGLLKYIP